MKIYLATGAAPVEDSIRICALDDPDSDNCPTCGQGRGAVRADRAYTAGTELGDWLANNAHASFFEGVCDGMGED